MTQNLGSSVSFLKLFGPTGPTPHTRAALDGAATIHFTDAITSRGIPYEDVRLQVRVLHPI